MADDTPSWAIELRAAAAMGDTAGVQRACASVHRLEENDTDLQMVGAFDIVVDTLAHALNVVMHDVSPSAPERFEIVQSALKHATSLAYRLEYNDIDAMLMGTGRERAGPIFKRVEALRFFVFAKDAAHGDRCTDGLWYHILDKPLYGGITDGLPW